MASVAVDRVGLAAGERMQKMDSANVNVGGVQGGPIKGGNLMLFVVMVVIYTFV